MPVEQYATIPLKLNHTIMLKSVCIGCLSVGLLMGCATRPNVSGGYHGKVPEYYTVRRGDTLSKIAYRYGLDYRKIGAINHLDSRYTIYVNQRLRLAPSKTKVQAYQRPTTWQYQPKPVTQAPKTQPKVSVQQPVYRPQPSNTSLNSSHWQRPVSGAVIRPFDLTKNQKGVYFAGQAGDSIFASQAGEVIYANNGLKEYGNLILIRHADNYITAYAHCQNILVKEGEQVRRGQQIATMGSTGRHTNQVLLEFQVRKDGKAIDPMSVL